MKRFVAVVFRLPTVLAAIALACSVAPAADEPLQQILEAVRRHRVIFSSVECKYRIEGRTSEEYLRVFSRNAVSSTTEVHFVVQEEMFYLKEAVHRIMPDGKVDLDWRITAYDGEKSRHLRDGTLLQISDEPVPLGSFIVLPHNLGCVRIAENDDELLDFLTPRNEGNMRTTVQVVGRAQVGGMECLVVETTRTRPDGLFDKMRFFFCPRMHYLVAKCETFYPAKKGQQLQPLIFNETSDWREVAPGIWLPFQVVSTSYVPNLKEKTYISNGTATYRLLEVNLNPNYPKSFFSNVPMPKDGVIETFRGDELVSRRVVGNPRDPEEDKTGLPPWVWLLGNVVLVAFLLGVYLRYRQGQTRPTSSPEQYATQEKKEQDQ